MTLKTQGLQSLDEIHAFLEGTQPLWFTAPGREAAYDWISAELRRFRYLRLGKADKGLVRRYLCKVTGLSRAQMSRLIKQFRDTRYERLAGISNGQLYNLRQSKTYQRVRGTVGKTHPVKVAIGERRKPRPEGRPGFLRVDSVHQGDLDGIKGLYHINLVDEVSKFQFVGSVERISEHFLLPVLEDLLNAFPFTILGFHADNGSEYINKQFARLLEKLRIEQFTKSRARRTNDNALVESKNGSVVSKHLGYAHIPGRFARRVNDFTQTILSPYLNFHRPCLFPTEHIDANGRLRKRYHTRTS